MFGTRLPRLVARRRCRLCRRARSLFSSMCLGCFLSLQQLSKRHPSPRPRRKWDEPGMSPRMVMFDRRCKSQDCLCQTSSLCKGSRSKRCRLVSDKIECPGRVTLSLCCSISAVLTVECFKPLAPCLFKSRERALTEGNCGGVSFTSLPFPHQALVHKGRAECEFWLSLTRHPLTTFINVFQYELPDVKSIVSVYCSTVLPIAN